MTEFLTTSIDKFTFKVATDRYYNAEGIWAREEGGRIRTGLSDFVQQRSGDVAFAEVKPAGKKVACGEELAIIETIKVNVSLASPVRGTIVESNPAMASTPEAINLDPYGDGWLALIEPLDWEADKARLLDARAYFEKMRLEVEQEVKK
jgi:glycine cleavage system H protein